MYDNTIRGIKLETHETKDISDKRVNGKLTVIWRDWDKILDYQPKMVYISSVNPNETKGPHIHTKRTSHFVCIEGKVIFIAKDNEGNIMKLNLVRKNQCWYEFLKTFPQHTLIYLQKHQQS